MDLGNDRKVMVLQGGGALGAFQAGAYEALHEAGVRPEWVAGISIGGINAAIIAGSPEHRRVENLRLFWETVSGGPSALSFDPPTLIRKWMNEYSSTLAAVAGVNGFYLPRTLMPWQYLADPMASVSYYDTSPLVATLESMLDFELLNHGPVRLSLGAVNVRSGNFTYFDNHANKSLSARHVAASGALPPGFPPVYIDGEYYWDGGLVSNTPLQWVMDQRDRTKDVCIFQVDLFSAKGDMPRDLPEVLAREKEIRYSSRTRFNTDEAALKKRYEQALSRVLDRLPSDFDDDPDVAYLRGYESDGAITVVHLIYRRKPYETLSMDNEFSRLTMEEHWRQGYDDVRETLSCSSWRDRTRKAPGFTTIDHKRGSASR